MPRFCCIIRGWHYARRALFRLLCERLRDMIEACRTLPCCHAAITSHATCHAMLPLLRHAAMLLLHAPRYADAALSLATLRLLYAMPPLLSRRHYAAHAVAALRSCYMLLCFVAAMLSYFVMLMPDAMLPAAALLFTPFSPCLPRRHTRCRCRHTYMLSCAATFIYAADADSLPLRRCHCHTRHAADTYMLFAAIRRHYFLCLHTPPYATMPYADAC